MADTTPLLASLLMQQKQDYNPFADQRKYGRGLIVNASSTAPLQGGGWLEGLSRALQGGIGGLLAGYADKEEKDQQQHNVGIYAQAAAERDPARVAELLKGLKGGDSQQTALFGQIIQNNINEGLKQQQAQGVYNRSGAGSGTTPGGGTGNGLVIDINKPTPAPGGAAAAIGGIESGGQKDPYAAVGPVSLVSGRQARPYGKYQVMDFNVGPWTKEVLGQEMTPEQFTASPQAQEQVFKTKFGQYLQQTGNPQDAASMWFSGKPLAQAGTTPDVLGTTPKAYVDKFTAAGGAGPQVAQAGGPPQGPQPSPPQIGQVPPSPEAAQFRAQEQQFARQGDYVQANAYRQKALEAEAKWASALQQKQAEIGMQGAEADRQQAGKTMNNEQSLSATFADRMAQSNAIIDKVGPALGDFKSRSLDSKVLGVGVPGANYMVSDEYRQARQARDNFINSQLRRESGAAIAPSEYENADRQYFPQPGDDPTTLANKARNRQAAVEGMVRGAGPTYQPPQAGAAPAAKAGGNELLDQAREAIRQGKDRAKVIEVLKANGGDPGQL